MREDFCIATLEDLLDYIQPTEYIVSSTEYNDNYKTPVLTPGKSFILGYTNETSGIFNDIPAIIFDDFTTAIKFVNFKFKVKSYAMKILVPSHKELFIKYVYYFMETIRINTDTHKRYWISIVSKYNIPLAPLPEQRAIVAKIEKLFSDMDNGVANLKAAKDKLEIFRQAVLKKAFEGEFTKEWRNDYSGQTAKELYEKVLSCREKEYQKLLLAWSECNINHTQNKIKKPKRPLIGSIIVDEEKVEYSDTPNTWQILRFVDLIKYEENGIKRGPFGSAIKKAFFVPSGYKVYEQQNAINDDSSLGTYFINENKYNELIGFSVKGGDYIVSCSGTIGRIHKLPLDCPQGVINQALLKIVLDEELMESKYFLFLFRSESFQRKILKGTRGTGMQNLASVDEIKELIIQLPPKEEQLEIINEIETRLSFCDNILATIDEALVKTEALRQSVLKKAFEGRLLDEAELESCRKEADWEPADKLLMRIKKEKEAKR